MTRSTIDVVSAPNHLQTQRTLKCTRKNTKSNNFIVIFVSTALCVGMALIIIRRYTLMRRPLNAMNVPRNLKVSNVLCYIHGFTQGKSLFNAKCVQRNFPKALIVSPMSDKCILMKPNFLVMFAKKLSKQTTNKSFTRLVYMLKRESIAVMNVKRTSKQNHPFRSTKKFIKAQPIDFHVTFA